MHYKWDRGTKHLPNISEGYQSKRKSCLSTSIFRNVVFVSSRQQCRFACQKLSFGAEISWRMKEEGKDLKSAHDSFINQLAGRVGRLNEVCWLWIMYRTDKWNRGRVIVTLCRCFLFCLFLKTGWHSVIFVICCKRTVGVSGRLLWSQSCVLSPFSIQMFLYQCRVVH